MHPYMAHRDYLSSSLPYVRAARKRAKVGGAIRNWVRSAYRHWQRNKMIAAFESLDDATLRDIGVYRGEIRSIVDGFDDHELAKVPVAATDDARRW